METLSMKDIVSNATRRNWEKLAVTSFAQKLNSRANKTLSKKTLIPKEYFKNIENVDKVLTIVKYIKENNIDIICAVNSLCLSYIKNNRITNSEIPSFIDELQSNIDSTLSKMQLPSDENDILGAIYQCLLNEGEKNKSGSYYTPDKITNSLLNNIMLQENDKILDPCCGSGGFLLAYNHPNPRNIYGCDIDELAVKISKTNLIVKYNNMNFMPNIYAVDYLTLGENLFAPTILNMSFDYIITNPPWGTKYQYNYTKFYPQILSKELFSYFIVKSTQSPNPRDVI